MSGRDGLSSSLRFAAVVTLCLGAGPVLADARTDLARTTCAALDRAVMAEPEGPLLLASYRSRQGRPPEIEALRDVAFTYDNALAAIALFACGKPRSARRIADALVVAIDHDLEYHDGRIRNAYAAGPPKDGALALPGYWDAGRKAWSQDAYQVSFATGNAAWAALALLEAHRRTRQASYLDAARRILEWTRTNTFDERAPAGFVGGWFVASPHPVRQDWKSTEQNVDLAAAWTALDRAAPDATARAQAAIAGDFVRSQWDAKEGRFSIGTGPDGRTSDHDHSGLDAQIWPLLAMRDAPVDWRRALAFVDAAHGVDGGYGFNRAPDGLWTEGTAQVAAVLVHRGLSKRAAALWTVLAQQQTEEGWLFATPKPRIATGLAIGPASTTSDFFYYHLPHLGATAWAAIAARGVDPFTGS